MALLRNPGVDTVLSLSGESLAETVCDIFASLQIFLGPMTQSAGLLALQLVPTAGLFLAWESLKSRSLPCPPQNGSEQYFPV